MRGRKVNFQQFFNNGIFLPRYEVHIKYSTRNLWIENLSLWIVVCLPKANHLTGTKRIFSRNNAYLVSNFWKCPEIMDGGPKFCFPLHKAEKSALCRYSLTQLIGTPNHWAGSQSHHQAFLLESLLPHWL